MLFLDFNLIAKNKQDYIDKLKEQLYNANDKASKEAKMLGLSTRSTMSRKLDMLYLNRC